MSRIEDGGAVEAGLVDLIRTAVRFYDIAAGEGLLFDAQPDPADYISEFLGANPDAWDRLDSFVAEAVAAKDAEITRLRAENAGMRTEITRKNEALQPFADEVFRYEPDEDDDNDIAWSSDFSIGDLRRARTALSNSSQAEGQTP